MGEALVRIENVTKTFGDVRAVDGVSLEIGASEFFALLGPSGCGKTSLMRLVAGFESPDSGRVFIDGKDMAGTPVYHRPVNMMFQSYALFPHMSVERNIAFGLVQQGMAKADIARRVQDMLKLVRLEGYGDRKPDQLSGGQKQRVALARALAPQPKLLLLDEPLAALDRKLRADTQFELMRVQRDFGVAFLVVTHDQDEAMAMAQRIALMNAGRIVQIGDARSIYEEPESLFAAEFIGEINLFDARTLERGGAVSVIGAGPLAFEFTVADGAPGAAVKVAVRPERMVMSHARMGAVAQGEGVIEDLAWLGDLSVWRVRMADGAVVRVSRSNAQADAGLYARGDRVFVGFDPASARVLTK